MRTRWTDYYNECSISGMLSNLKCHARLIERIIKKNPKKILEIGTGTGTMAIFLSYLGYDVTSIDNDRHVLKNAKNLSRGLNGKVRFARKDAFDLSGLGSFDVVFSQGFFEHFSDDEIQKLAREQLRIGRHVLISVPSRYYSFRDFGNERLMSKSQWRGVLKGFNISEMLLYGKNTNPKRAIAALVKFPSFPLLKKNHLLVEMRR